MGSTTISSEISGLPESGARIIAMPALTLDDSEEWPLAIQLALLSELIRLDGCIETERDRWLRLVLDATEPGRRSGTTSSSMSGSAVFSTKDAYKFQYK